jgi:hypothetical protein
VTCAVVVGLLGGCSHTPPSPTPTVAPAGPSSTTSASPTTSGSPDASSATTSPTPTAPATDPAIVFAADGIGPYVIGVALADLQAHGQVTNLSSSPFCTNYTGGEATGRYAGTITLTFHLGHLTQIHTLSNQYVTPSGAKLGMTLSDLQGIYGARGTLITGALSKGFSVRVESTGLAIVFLIDSSGNANAMSGGEATPLEDAVVHGEGC